MSKSNKKLGTRAHQSLTPPARELPCMQGNITRSSFAYRFKPFCRQQGAADLDLRGYTGKVIPAQIFGHASHNGLLPSGLSAVLLTVPFYWITFAMICFADFHVYNGNIKEKPAPSKSQQTAGQASETG